MQNEGGGVEFLEKRELKKEVFGGRGWGQLFRIFDYRLKQDLTDAPHEATDVQTDHGAVDRRTHRHVNVF